MKEKTSITLSTDILEGIDRLAGQGRSRSAVIETVLRHYLRQKARQEIRARDLERLNQHADALNEEATEVLAFQSLDESSR